MAHMVSGLQKPWPEAPSEREAGGEMSQGAFLLAELPMKSRHT